MSSPFGGIGWTRHSDDERAEVDTVPFGAFRPDAFRRAGLFDESLVRNQDDEFNLRLRLAGGRIVRRPVDHARIHTAWERSAELFRQYYEYGRWKAPVMLKHRRIVSVRSLAPVALLALVPRARDPLRRDAPRRRASWPPRRSRTRPAPWCSACLAVRSRGRAAGRLLPRVVLAFATDSPRATGSAWPSAGCGPGSVARCRRRASLTRAVDTAGR